MKTKNLILAAVVSIFTFGSLMANQPVMASKDITNSVTEIVQEKLYYPEFAIEDKLQGKVAVEIQITEEGKFDVVAANSLYTNLKSYATKTIEGIETDKFKDYAGQNVILYLNYDLTMY